MNLGELRTELYARGFDHLGATRSAYFINRAYLEVCEEEEWPFLEATATGTAPLTITDLRTIESVINTTNTVKLIPLDRRLASDIGADLTTAGNPAFYYVDNDNIVTTYPVRSDSLSVRYWKAPEPLSGDSDEPLLPSRFHYSLLDGATAYSYFDSDEFEAAAQNLELWEASKLRMREALLNRQIDGPDDYIISRYAHLDR